MAGILFVYPSRPSRCHDDREIAKFLVGLLSAMSAMITEQQGNHIMKCDEGKLEKSATHMVCHLV